MSRVNPQAAIASEEQLIPKGELKFGMEIPETMITDAIKESSKYKYYKIRKDQSEKNNAEGEPKEQNVSPIVRGRDKGDDDATGFGVFMHNKSKELPKFTPFSPIVTCLNLEDFTNLNDLSKQELIDLLSKPVFTNAQTTSVVPNPKGNPKDPPNDHEGETRKKRRKDAGKPSLDLQRKTKLPWILFKKTFLLINPKTKKKNLFRCLPTRDGLQRNRAMAKKLKELIKKDELTISNLEGVVLELLKKQYNNYVVLEYHVDQLKAEVYHIEGIEHMYPDRWSKKIHLYQIDALNVLKVQENLIKMVNENRIGYGNNRLEGRDCSKNDIKRSNEMLEKIANLKHREQLRRLEEYVRGRSKTFDSHTFVIP
nr:hypothetical protein [Tanacetum cinerariifolium]GEW23745.1 hypothetical protein [Tanacetum cinerariifolium]